jgi:outer membrane protein OmpA-like peptidoglycan-associated protein
MNDRRLWCCVALLAVFVSFVSVRPALAQDGRLRIHVTPKQAYAFVDGNAVGEASRRTMTLSPGDHKVDLYNYGYKPVTRTVSIASGKTSTLVVMLDAEPGTVTGPWGAITIEGANRDAILLNGKTPDFFVGHGDEFNHNWLWKQELVVPPGSHQVTVLEGTKEVWSGTVNVPANQRVVIGVPKGVRKTVAWPRGDQLKSLPRFKAGIASATVAVAKPTAQLSAGNMSGTAASNGQVACGDSAQLKWTSTDASHSEITGLGNVATSGEQTVKPDKTTAFNLTASGPGGTANSSATVNVNDSLQANLDATPREIRYRRVGDQVVEQGSATLNWSTSNASSLSIEPLGSVNANGNRTLQLTPTKTDPGNINETVTYVLTATNSCGASERRTASVHITGSIESAAVEKQLEAKLALHSIYFPTDQPKASKPMTGLLSSQQALLTTLASDFKKYLAFKPDARLILEGHADVRGSKEYNQALSQRRLDATKHFLVEQGISQGAIEDRPLGSQQNLNAEEVKKLIDENPDLTEQDKQKLDGNLPTLVLANNRSVDVTLSSTGQQSVRYYPFNAKDSLTLIQRK